MSRSQSALLGQTIGSESIELAHKYQVPLLLSLSAWGSSLMKPWSLGHGLFTAALLEALEKRCNTLAALSDRTRGRLLELCDYYWRPIQTVVSLVANDLQNTVVVPHFQPSLNRYCLCAEQQLSY